MTRVRIGVDATSWDNPRGYGRFARNVIRSLVELDGGTTVRLYIDGASVDAASLPARAEIRPVPLSKPSSSARADSSRRLIDVLRLTRAVRREDVDVFLFPSDYTFFPVLGVPTVVGVHDAIATELPELTLAPGRARLLWQAKRRVALARATRIFTVSNAARDALVRLLGVDPDVVPVVPEAADPVFSPRSPQATAPELAALGLGTREPFFLYTGGISPHKNLETLIDAYGRLPADARPRLVIVGSLDGGPYLSAADSVRAAIERRELQEAVLLPGFVSDETLACLYSAATATVLPSLAEGFGLPAVEAAACGSPVVLSDLAAHRESMGEAALYFSPTDVDALTDHLRRVLDDGELRAELGAAAHAAAARLTWTEAAERVHALLADVTRRNGAQR